MLAKVTKVEEKDNVIKLQIKKVNDIVESIEMLHPSGVASKPIIGSNVFTLDLNKNHTVGLAFEDFNLNLNIKEGEIVVYSTDKNGNIKAKIHLANDGKILLDTKNNIIVKSKKIELNGNTKNFVTHAALDAAIKKFIVNLNTHTHGSSMGPTSPPAKPMNLDISASKTTTVVTG